ncbi:MAG TPA: hypothetical protein DCL38_07610 [Lachnospiraceae bacterium]|nr:hypothetical protein [Lachnospiraceae bacterium]
MRKFVNSGRERRMKRMKIKKGMAGLVLCCVLAAGGAIPVHADNNNYSEDGTASCVVTATLQSTYTVSLPAALALSYDSEDERYEGSFSYGVKGNIAMDKKVSVTAPASFDLTGAASGDAVTAAITLPFTAWSNDEESSTNALISASAFNLKTGSVSADITQADAYSGNFSFTFGMEDK